MGNIRFILAAVVLLICGVLASRAGNNETAQKASQAPDLCVNNQPYYVCPTGNSGLDFYPSPGEGPGNPQYQRIKNNVQRQIVGTISKYSGNEVDISASTGQIFKVFFPVAGVDWWNQNRGPNYGDFRIRLGDPLVVVYSEAPTAHSTTIEGSQLLYSEVLVRASKSSPSIGHITDFSYQQ